MRMRIEKSEDGTRRSTISPAPGDLPVSGFVGDGKRITFLGENGYRFTARSFDEEEAVWLGAVLHCIAASCVAMLWIAFDPSQEAPYYGPLFLLVLYAFGLAGSSLREESFAWKEVLFLAATVALVGNPGSSEVLWFAAGSYALLLILYAWLWKERAVWEPFVFLALFSIAIFARRFGFLPELVAPIVFLGLLLFSLFGYLTVLSSGWAYSQGWNRMQE